MDQECILLPFLIDFLACNPFGLNLQLITPLYETPPLIRISLLGGCLMGKDRGQDLSISFKQSCGVGGVKVRVRLWSV